MSNELATTEDRIASRIRPEIASQTGVGSNGMMAFKNMEQIMEFSKVMSIAQVAIPKHLRSNPGACLAVAIQASEWEMSPFSVANKTYVVNDRLAYEAQLINAVILRRAPIVGRFKITYSGEGDKRRCKVAVKLKDGDEVEYESPEIVRIPVKNSPLWKGDPDQQLFYYSSRAMCRRHFPDVILGIYTPDEIAEETMKVVHPIAMGRVGVAALPAASLAPSMTELAGPKTTEEAPQGATQEQGEPAAGEQPSEPQPEAPPKKPTGPDAKGLVKTLIAKGAEIGAGKVKLAKTLAEMQLVPEGQSLDDTDAKTLANALDAWDEIKERIQNPKE